MRIAPDARLGAIDRGSAAIEMVLLTPVLVVLLLFVIHVGRTSEGVSELRHAADQGARAASLVARSRMNAAAVLAVRRDLVASGSSCEKPTVAVTLQISGFSSSVRVDVRCQVSNLGLAMIGSRPVRLSATSTEVVDRFRGG
ncbi:MAG: TadE/TadG family type IV pilus assembly protein [Actinomycetota bacterium]